MVQGQPLGRRVGGAELADRATAMLGWFSGSISRNIRGRVALTCAYSVTARRARTASRCEPARPVPTSCRRHSRSRCPSHPDHRADSLRRTRSRTTGRSRRHRCPLLPAGRQPFLGIEGLGSATASRCHLTPVPPPDATSEGRVGRSHRSPAFAPRRSPARSVGLAHRRPRSHRPRDERIEQHACAAASARAPPRSRAGCVGCRPCYRLHGIRLSAPPLHPPALPLAWRRPVPLCLSLCRSER